jgi:hypothetical protein
MTNKVRGVLSNPQMSFTGDWLLLSGYANGVGVVNCSSLNLKSRGFPKELWYKNKAGEKIKVLSAVALPSSGQIAICLDGTKQLFIVNKDSLICQPRKLNTD